MVGKNSHNKSTLSYANAHRPGQMYREFFFISRYILADQHIRLNGFKCKKCAYPLRKVAVRNRENSSKIVKIDGELRSSSRHWNRS